MNDFASLTVWGWFVLAAVLIGLEMLLPGVFLIWLGMAAAATGLINLLHPLDWPFALLLFAVLGVVFAWIGRRVSARVEARDKNQPFLNRRADALVGQTFTLSEPIVNGEGRIRIGDTVWHIKGPEAGAGTRIKVVRVEGGRLVVK
jgi:inner membrane protein